MFMLVTIAREPDPGLTTCVPDSQPSTPAAAESVGIYIHTYAHTHTQDAFIYILVSREKKRGVCGQGEPHGSKAMHSSQHRPPRSSPADALYMWVWCGHGDTKWACTCVCVCVCMCMCMYVYVYVCVCVICTCVRACARRARLQ
jgi:hypothetical protein